MSPSRLVHLILKRHIQKRARAPTHTLFRNYSGNVLCSNWYHNEIKTHESWTTPHQVTTEYQTTDCPIRLTGKEALACLSVNIHEIHCCFGTGRFVTVFTKVSLTSQFSAPVDSQRTCEVLFSVNSFIFIASRPQSKRKRVILHAFSRNRKMNLAMRNNEEHSIVHC